MSRHEPRGGPPSAPARAAGAGLALALAALLRSARAANPVFVVDGAAEARECSSQVAFTGWCGSSLMDSDRGWMPEPDDASPWMQINLGGAYLVDGLAMKRMGGCCGPKWAVSSYSVEVSLDGDAWTDLGAFAGPTADTADEAIVEARFATAAQAHYIRITPTEWATVDNRHEIGLRVAALLTFRDAFSVGRCSYHAGCPQGEPIAYVGCYNADPDKTDDKAAGPPGWAFAGGGDQALEGIHTPETCNTACLGYESFALYQTGYCFCGGGDFGVFGEAPPGTCNAAHSFGHGLASGCRNDPAFLCGGDKLMVYTVRQPPAGAADSYRVVGERWSTPLRGSDARAETSWPTQCVTAADVAAVRAKCELIDGETPPSECAGIYCAKVLPQPDKADVVSTFPATPDDCAGATCRRYRLQWLFSSELITPARLAKFYGTLRPEGTKWFILPDLGWIAPDNAGAFDEIREADVWLEDLGEVTNATYYLDTEGEYSRFRKFTFAFYPYFLRLAPVDDNDHYYYEVQFSGQFGPIPNGFVPEDQRAHYENFVNPRAVVKHYKYYDLVNAEALCQSRGGCPFQQSSDLSDFEGYARTVPSWMELKTFVLTNAVRNNARDGVVRYFGYDPEIAKAQLTETCGLSEELTVTDGSHPKYLHLPSVEFNRLKAWACAGHPDTSCSHSLPPQADLDRFGVPRDRGNWLLDQPHVWPFEHGLDYPEGWIESGLLHAASHFTYADAVEQIGGPPYLGSCGHFGGMFNPVRPMGSIAFYPRESWQAADPLNEEGYGIGVQLQCGMAQDNRSLWATQPWNNVGLNTYQPIPSGVHLVVDTANDDAYSCRNCDQASRALRFVAQYYDSSGMPPDAFEVVLDGTAHPMELMVGKAHRGTYEYEHPGLGNSTDAPCLSYVFRTRNRRGTFFLPQSGLYVYRTYGIGSCREQWRPQACTQPGVCRSSCGFPGTPCGAAAPDPGGGGGAGTTTDPGVEDASGGARVPALGGGTTTGPGAEDAGGSNSVPAFGGGTTTGPGAEDAGGSASVPAFGGGTTTGPGVEDAGGSASVPALGGGTTTGPGVEESSGSCRVPALGGALAAVFIPVLVS